MSAPAAFRDAFVRLLRIEGDFSDDPLDSGGATRWGITEFVARRHGYDGPMNALPHQVAERIYHESYWRPLGLDHMHAGHPEIAYELFDSGVNVGVGLAARWLQRALNVLNREARDYPDLLEDGHIGPATLGALDAFTRRRGRSGTVVLLRALNCLQGAFYIELAERRQKDERFLYGWLLQRVEIE
jgi:lysozyme family protein